MTLHTIKFEFSNVYIVSRYFLKIGICHDKLIPETIVSDNTLHLSMILIFLSPSLVNFLVFIKIISLHVYFCAWHIVPIFVNFKIKKSNLFKSFYQRV